MFLEKLVEIVANWWGALLPFEVVDAYEAGVVLRLGVYHRTVGPGLRWKWPLAERVLTTRTCVTTVRLPTQTLTTRDGQTVAVTSMIKYRVHDVREFLLVVWDSIDVLGDVTMGAIKRAVNTITYEKLQDPDGDTEARVLDAVRKEVNQYGFRVVKITFTELCRVRALRLLNDSLAGHAGNLDN